MTLEVTLIVVIIWALLGWRWSVVLMKLDAYSTHYGRNYVLSFIFWPFSMLLWDASQQEHDYDDQY